MMNKNKKYDKINNYFFCEAGNSYSTCGIPLSAGELLVLPFLGLALDVLYVFVHFSATAMGYI